LKERILSEARDTFKRDGFARVSVDELASSLAMSKKTFYRAFDSKDALIHQIMDRHLAYISSEMSTIVASKGSFVAKLGEVLEFIGNLPARIGFNFIRDVQRHLPHLWKEVEEFRAKRVIDGFGRLIDQGIQEGYIRPDLNKRIFLLAYLAAIQNVIQPTVLANESFSAREALQGVVELFFRGTMTEKGRQDFEKLRSHNT
jgi:AcrR family transcriptional regulator